MILLPARTSTLNYSLSADPVAYPTENTWYHVVSTDNATGCQDHDSVYVRVRQNGVCGPPDLFIPSGFSPDGNGENDVLRVRGNYIVTLLMIIYDRWGEKMKEFFSQNDSWDGTYPPVETGSVCILH